MSVAAILFSAFPHSISFFAFRKGYKSEVVCCGQSAKKLLSLLATILSRWTENQFPLEIFAWAPITRAFVRESWPSRIFQTRLPWRQAAKTLYRSLFILWQRNRKEIFSRLFGTIKIGRSATGFSIIWLRDSYRPEFAICRNLQHKIRHYSHRHR